MIQYPPGSFQVPGLSGRFPYRQLAPIQQLKVPNLADFQWVNQGPVQALQLDCGILLAGPGEGSGTDLHILKQTAPPPPYTVTAALLNSGVVKNFHGSSLLFRQSSDGKLATFNIGSTGMQNQKFTSHDAAGFSAEYQTFTWNAQLGVVWMQIRDDGTNRLAYLLGDGSNPLFRLQAHSVSRTDFLTADEVGVHLSCENQATPYVSSSLLILSWEVTLG